MSSPPPLRVGVLLCGPVQLLDIAAVDLLGMATPEYIKLCGMPDALVSIGHPTEFKYIGEGKKPGDIIEVTSTMKVVMTVRSVPNCLVYMFTTCPLWGVALDRQCR